MEFTADELVEMLIRDKYETILAFMKLVEGDEIISNPTQFGLQVMRSSSYPYMGIPIIYQFETNEAKITCGNVYEFGSLMLKLQAENHNLPYQIMAHHGPIGKTIRLSNDLYKL